MLLSIVSNFVASPFAEVFNYWSKQLKFNVTLQFASFNQVHQFLVEGAGQGNSKDKCTIILLQLEKWITGERQSTVKTTDVINDFCDALQEFIAQTLEQVLIVICPVSPSFIDNIDIYAAEKLIRSRLDDGIPAELVTSSTFASKYPVDNYIEQFDAFSDKSAGIPYTRLCFATIATIVARACFGWWSPARKVIVVDCDNTLWSGYCGEVGIAEILITEMHLKFHDFLLNQVAGGKLLCLCSKNDDARVFEVIDKHPACRIRRESIAAFRINWQPKTLNLQELSQELDVDLSAFIFIDDDDSECFSVTTSIPQVLTLRVPETYKELFKVLSNVWEFDLNYVTVDDTRRSLYYQQNKLRENVKKTSLSLDDFIGKLDIHIEMTFLNREDIGRAVQLLRRTNQFNLNGYLKSPAELMRYVDLKTGWIFRIKDRFGDYGAAGLLLLDTEARGWKVDSFVLSCRALGKRVEHEILYRLASMAIEAGHNLIEFSYTDTGRNVLISRLFKEFMVQQVDMRYVGNPETLLKCSRKKDQSD